MKSQAKAATQVVVRTSARARVRHSRGQLGGGARGRGSDTARAAWGYKEYFIVTYIQGVPYHWIHFVFVNFLGSRAHTEELFIAIG